MTGEELAVHPVAERDGVELQLVRTIPDRVYDRFPNGEFTILESYLRALRSAERLVYLESQFLWSPELVAVLADKLEHAPDDAGACEDCGEDIPWGRLKAMPFAELCVVCQGKRDRPHQGPTRRGPTDFR